MSIGAIIKNPEMLRFVPGLIKTKKMCENAVKKFPFVMGMLLTNIRLKKYVIKLF